jgi:hypothetical protein
MDLVPEERREAFPVRVEQVVVVRDECFGYIVGRPARESISDVLASRRWRGGTAADMVLAPLLVSNAGCAKPLSTAQLKEAVGMDQKMQRAAPDDRCRARKTRRELKMRETSGSKALETRFAKSGMLPARANVV